ncbi:MAG: hypothetical protein PHC51_13680 [bacterium]|nr:hypothetical protein [bacterium]
MKILSSLFPARKLTYNFRGQLVSAINVHATSALIAALCAITIGPTIAFSDDNLCVYRNDQGVTVQVNGQDKIPSRFKNNSHCFTGQNTNYLASPDNVSLEGSTGRRVLNTSLGKMELRWSRSVQSLFRRSPEKALSDAATAAAKALRSNGFPSQLAEKARTLPWKIVFMDDTAPASEIPQNLISNCHPAWMTAPANLYIVSQRVAAGCESNRQKKAQGVSDSELAHILIHEMGHVIEYLMIGNLQSAEKMRAEGFASWFEQFASDYSSSVKDGSVKDYYMNLAKESFRSSPSGFNFQGSAYDYARASTYFHAVVRRGGIRSLIEVYDTIAKDKSSLATAISKVMRWDKQRLEEEAKKVT